MSNKIALFTTTDVNYVRYAVRCFEIFNHYNPGIFDFFVMCSSKVHIQTDIEVNFLKVDYSQDYKIENGWPYPSECFWLFKAPDILHDMGYKYSMYVDSDTVNFSRLDFSFLPDVKVIAGATRIKAATWKPVKAIEFIQTVDRSNFGIVKNEFGLKNTQSDSINSGVLIFNNSEYVSRKISKLSVDLFNRSKAIKVPRRGDDSLLALIMLCTPPHFYMHLGSEWNHYYETPNSQRPKKSVNGIKILHMAKIKPWKVKSAIKNPALYHGAVIWNSPLGTIKKVGDKMPENKASHKLWWWRPAKSFNFGDEITPWLFNKMFNYNQEKPADPRSHGVLLAVGSIMRLSGPNTNVWGSGIRNIDQMDFKKAKNYNAVRGLFTVDQLKRLKFLQNDNVALGDPGLLLPNYYLPRLPKKYKLGIIPHVVDFKELKAHFGNHADVLIIDLNTDNIEAVVDQIVQCEATISTSLHGVIESVAYGIPTRWYKYSDRINGDDIKYYDFFSSLDPEVFEKFDRKAFKSHDHKYDPLVFDSNQTIEDLISQTYLYDMSNFDAERLIAACPITISK